MDEQPTWMIVQRDQCNGRFLSCVNCGANLGERHKPLCYAAGQAYMDQKRARKEADGDKRG